MRLHRIWLSTPLMTNVCRSQAQPHTAVDTSARCHNGSLRHLRTITADSMRSQSHEPHIPLYLEYPVVPIPRLGYTHGESAGSPLRLWSSHLTTGRAWRAIHRQLSTSFVDYMTMTFRQSTTKRTIKSSIIARVGSIQSAHICRVGSIHPPIYVGSAQFIRPYLTELTVL